MLIILLPIPAVAQPRPLFSDTSCIPTHAVGFDRLTKKFVVYMTDRFCWRGIWGSCQPRSTPEEVRNCMDKWFLKKSKNKDDLLNLTQSPADNPSGASLFQEENLLTALLFPLYTACRRRPRQSKLSIFIRSLMCVYTI